MIGMMNSGAEQSVEFYAAARQSSLYQIRKKSSQSRTYTAEGRIMINGEPLSPHGADDMWKNVIIKAAATKMIKDCEKKESGPMATIRRLSEKLKLKKSKSSAAMMNLDLSLPESSTKAEIAEEEEGAADNQYVTMIKIDTVEPYTHEENTTIERPDILFEEDVMEKILEESVKNDRKEQKAKNNNDEENDSGKGSIDERIVEKM